MSGGCTSYGLHLRRGTLGCHVCSRNGACDFQLVWQYKQNLTKDMRFDEAASEVCKASLEQVSDI